MVRSGDPPHHPGAARALLPSDDLDERIDRTGAAPLRPRTAGWYGKPALTFSDAIAAVRRVFWCPPDLSISRRDTETVEIPAGLLRRLAETLCYAA